MKSLIKTLFLLGLLLTQTSNAEVTTDYPKLFFSYSWLFDRALCGETIDQTWAKEAISKESHFTKIWEDSAPDLFGVLFKKFKGRFSRKELTATLSVCPKLISFSYPITLKVTWYLKSYMQEKPVRPDHVFLELVFHELMHTWVNENLRQSKLLEKYKTETLTVQNHLHLMALEQFVFTAAKRTDLLKWIETYYSSEKDDYGRAWEIVQKEGYSAFISEFNAN